MSEGETAKRRGRRTLVDSDHVSSGDLLLRQLVNHLLSEVVHRLHVCALHRELAGLSAL
jgi:hypothetical protein